MTTSIFSTSWIDIVFDGRNQQYGAYELRQMTERNMLFAILLSVTALSLGVNVILLDGKPNGSSNFALIDDSDTDTLEVTLTNVELPPPPVDEPEPVQPPLPPPPVNHVATQEFTLIEIVPDATANVDTVAAQESFGEREAGLTTQAGDTGTFVIETPPEAPVGPGYVLIAEKMPAFPGGDEALLKYLGKNTVYPEPAKDVGIEGTVYVEFVVDYNGKLTSIRVAKGPHKWLNDEAVRVVKSMPDWSPGMQNGQPVRVKFVVPIRFELT